MCCFTCVQHGFLLNPVVDKSKTGDDDAANKGRKSKTKELTTLLEDGGRAQNIEIALKSRQITAEQVRRRLDDYDVASLSFESLQIVVQMYPSPEEIGQLKKPYSTEPDAPPLCC